ncbi:MAG: hypothetical protein KDN20_11450 [Verrucomicrobiae bacterium]|nr:hypothetical protein [Verrucomicrobiae bacterium]
MSVTLLMAGLLASFAGCEKGPTESTELREEQGDGLDEFGLPELPKREVARDSGKLSDNEKEETEENPSELITRIFPIPSGLITRKSAREILESYGIEFGEGSSATYNPQSNEITVRQTREQMSLVEAVLSVRYPSGTKAINSRIEIYEFPSASALKLQQSAEDQSDNSREWEETLRRVKEGTATFITSATVLSRSGRRAGVQDTFEVIYAEDFDQQNAEESKSVIPDFSTQNVGTALEVEPVIGGDGETIDINLSLEYHTSPPTKETVNMAVPGTEKAFDVLTPVFHAKKITTQLTLMDGEVKLIGAWRPTGKLEFETRDVMQVAFLKVDIQTTSKPH